MQAFDDIWERAVMRHGEDDLRARFPLVKSATELAATPDHRCLSAMTKRVFAAGFRWSVIEAKWQGFEEAFHKFDPPTVANFDHDELASLVADTRIVRNRSKILSTIDNAAFVQQISAEHGGFGKWISEWPSNDRIGLWATMKKGGSRLGGDTGPWFMRLIGADTFRVSKDVGQALVEAGVVEKHPSGKRALVAVQAAFNEWAEQSGLPQGHISVVLGCSVGEIYERR